MGENVDEILGLAPKQNQTKRLMDKRKKIKEEFEALREYMTDEEIKEIIAPILNKAA
jgi:hypothetical protein